MKSVFLHQMPKVRLVGIVLGGGAWAKLATYWGGAWAKLATELVWGGLVWADLVLSGLGKAREVGLG